MVSTTPGTKPVSSVTWAVYRDVNSLDPIYAFDYPENTAVSLMCESLLKQSPDGAIGPGLGTMTNPSPTSLVFTINKAATFWDGHPVTAADVVYSLDRAMSTSLGGFYTLVFSRVKSIAATGSDQVTITLKQPDYWLPGELASMPGVIIEKAFATKQGKKYGTPSGSIMCTGAYKLKSFVPGVGVTAVPNTSYWQPSVKPLVEPDHHQGRRLRHPADLGADHRRDPGHVHLGWPVHAAAAEGRQRGEHLQRPGLVHRRVHRGQHQGSAR